MSTQRTYFLDDNGQPGAGRKRATPEEVAACAARSTKRIPVRWFVAMAYHETGYTLNQQDDDIDDDGNVFHRTGGIFQLDIPSASPFQAGDAIKAFGPLIGATKSVYDLQDACDILAAESEELLNWLQLQASVPDDVVTDDMLFYLAMGHNMGHGAVKRTVNSYGIDMRAYIERNPTLNIVAHQYGIDATTGGPDYRAEMQPDPSRDSSSDAPTMSARGESLLGWGVVLLALMVAYWFFYERKKGASAWPVHL